MSIYTPHIQLPLQHWLLGYGHIHVVIRIWPYTHPIYKSHCLLGYGHIHVVIRIWPYTHPIYKSIYVGFFYILICEHIDMRTRFVTGFVCAAYDRDQHVTGFVCVTY